MAIVSGLKIVAIREKKSIRMRMLFFKNLFKKLKERMGGHRIMLIKQTAPYRECPFKRAYGNFGRAAFHQSIFLRDGGRRSFCKNAPGLLPQPYPLRNAVAKKMPPRMAAELRATRSVMGSLTNSTPPMAVITGTLNWTTAATVTVNRTTTMYQS